MAEKQNGAPGGLAQAEALFKAGRFQEALDAYRRVADLYPQAPDGPESLFWVGYLYLLNLGEEVPPRGMARQSFQALVARYPNAPQRAWAEILIRLIDQLEESEKKRVDGQQAHETLMQELGESKTEQERLLQEREALKRELEGLQQRIERLKGENAGLKTELKRLKDLDILLEKKSQPLGP
ncbi:MAG: tetratricopeptide repeat protein [Candidatus Tectomicrobia bacterium]|uniref:Tetratricopeptide repeat protein n=1 Tax=Tectimicrobiota bacterium TaxID=2528274 RepID=A0A932CQW5_UNCTE|nr:tetratricopeptide repeat protein [Candidatus Tectomicrobia bacterium]